MALVYQLLVSSVLSFLPVVEIMFSVSLDSSNAYTGVKKENEKREHMVDLAQLC